MSTVAIPEGAGMDLSDEWTACLGAIVAAPIAFPAEAEIARAHGESTLAELHAAGLVVLWRTDRAGKPLKEAKVTLSAFAAYKLDLVIVEVGKEEVPRWGMPWEIRRGIKVVREVGHRGLGEFAEHVPDEKSHGLDLLIDLETNKPLLLFGQTIARDRRIKSPVKRKARKARAKRGKAAKVRAPAEGGIRAELERLKAM